MEILENQELVGNLLGVFNFKTHVKHNPLFTVLVMITFKLLSNVRLIKAFSSYAEE